MKEKKQIATCFFLGTLLGGLSFFWIYGVRVLDVTYDTWLLQDASDLTQHYIGWQFFRQSQWQFPFGLIQNIFMNDVSVIYTDSIPIFALVFKLFSPLLPETFQYFGIWGLLSFSLQAGIAAVIIQKHVKKLIISICGASFFAIVPIVVWRMFGHTALASHWLILLAIALFAYRDEVTDVKIKMSYWGGLTVLASSIHIYFLPMVIGIMFFSFIMEYFEKKIWKQNVTIFIVSILLALITMYVLGAFYGVSTGEAYGFGFYSSNINTIINPQRTSGILPTLPLATEGQGEGYGYLGLGILILTVISVGLVFYRYIKKKEKMANRINIIICSICMIVFSAFAFSNVITCNGKILVQINLPNIILKICNIFRASGRFIWPVVYGLMFFSIITVAKICKKRFALEILVGALLLQITDVQTWLETKREHFANNIDYDTPFNNAIWQKIGENKEKIEFITFESEEDYNESEYLWSETQFTMKEIFQIAEYAYDNGMSINDFYLGRQDKNQAYEEKMNSLSDIKEGQADENTVYIFHEFPFSLIQNNRINLYEIDGFYIGLKNPINANYLSDSVIKLGEKILQQYSLTDRMEFSENVEYKDGTYILGNKGILYGPGLVLGKGNYTIDISGTNLENGYFVCTKNRGEQEISKKYEVSDTFHIKYEIDISEETSEIEFVCVNDSDIDINIADVCITLKEQENK